IRIAMEEQGQGSQQILEAVVSLNEITHLVKSGSVEMFEGSKDVIKESKNLETATAEIANSVEEITGGAEKVNAAVNRVHEISMINHEHINTLFAEVSKFKVE
ncbi:MAG: methyl-accepting chemotaxis protein, partial [Spirochaetaceae bacterium]|nr:methyl-accepting chemotaxis protein [Spirochaetaceae bacterium]